MEAVNSGPWGARVVYGDTDSLFVLFEGKSRAEVSGARITVWYEEEDKNNRKVSQSVRVARKVGR